jgi:two-component system chemotaxis sensor kinase CheA
MNPLLEQFLQEARENLAFIDQNLEDLGGGDSEILNSLFRAAHTLKGGSGIVGFESVKDITHYAEDLLDLLRANKITFEPQMVDTLYDAFDEVLNLIEAAEESGDIVDADETIVNKIIEAIRAQSGRGAVKEEWALPFTLVKGTNFLPRVDFTALSSYTKLDTIAFQSPTLDEANHDNPQLYLINFDVDEECMMFGNDPLYALSLLKESLISISSCMGEEEAKTVLSGLDDEDGLKFLTSIQAIVYGRYSEIEDALFNFIDEMEFTLLDIETIVNQHSGDETPQDVIKDLAQTLQNSQPEDVAKLIASTLKLLGDETKGYRRLKAVQDVLPFIMLNDAAQITPIVQAIASLAPFHYEKKSTKKSQETSQSNAKTASENSEEQSSEDREHLKNAIEDLLTQLNEQLSVLDESEVVERTKHILAILEQSVDVQAGVLNSKADIEEYITRIQQSLSGESVETAEEIGEAVQEEAVTDEGDQSSVDIAVEDDNVETTVEEPKVIEVVQPVSEEAVEEVVATAPKVVEEKVLDKKNVVGKSVKVEQESIDMLMNLVGELLVAKNSLPYLADGVTSMNVDMIKRAILEKYTSINRLSNQLQDLIMDMRMLPISYVFDRYPKLVRSISKDLGKKVKLSMDGGETKLDKNMIEMLADPLIHIMRNSLDHGIEKPDVRKEKGKSEEGHISLNAYAESDKIIIEIKDDGAGIDVDKVIHKVIEKELMGIEEIEKLSDHAKAELVMLPGLSTAEVLSEYSGRGVGMDVVKTSIEGFGGNISIRTEKDKGTTIRLTTPISIAVTSLLHVDMNQTHYGFPMDSVNETVKIEKDAIVYLNGEPFVTIREDVIPLLMVDSMLDFDALENKPLAIVVLNIRGTQLAVVVNALLGQLDVVQKPLEGALANHPIFSGTALLGNGNIIFAIDPLGLLQMHETLKTERKVA